MEWLFASLLPGSLPPDVSPPGKRTAGLLMRPSKNQLMVVLQHENSTDTSGQTG